MLFLYTDFMTQLELYFFILENEQESPLFIDRAMDLP